MQLFWNLFGGQDDISITQKGVAMNENACHRHKIMMRVVLLNAVNVFFSLPNACVTLGQGIMENFI